MQTTWLDLDAEADFLAGHRPLVSLTGLGFRRRCIRPEELEHILAGRHHAPVVYFARLGRGVKIGTSTRLAVRLERLYLTFADVLAVVPGDAGVEALYHQRFGNYRLNPGEGRAELFRLGLPLRLLLAGWRLNWLEAFVAVIFAVLATSLGYPAGVLTLTAIIGAMLMRPGWQWTAPRSFWAAPSPSLRYPSVAPPYPPRPATSGVIRGGKPPATEWGRR